MISRSAVWVLCVQAEPTCMELLGRARVLADEAAKRVVALTTEENRFPAQCLHAGADEVVVLTGATEDILRTADNVAGVLARYEPEIVLCPATLEGRALSAWVAARLETGLTADCTGLSLSEDGLLLQRRPAFGGNLIADILCRQRRPQMASVRPKVFPEPVLDTARTGPVMHVRCEGREYLRRVRTEMREDAPRMGEARIVVAGGKGIGSREGFEKLEKLAGLLGGEVGASRSAVDAGYAPYTRQIGQTGVTVRPRVYLALGISGRSQHIVGMQGAQTVIAVNVDRHAPIFMHADYGIVGDWEEAADEIIRYLEEKA